MKDLIGRLRLCADESGYGDDFTEAADALERLTAENAALREERALIVQRAENAEAALEGTEQREQMLLRRCDVLEDERNDSDTQLDAADALLREARTQIAAAFHTSFGTAGEGVLARIDAHLAREQKP